MSLDKYIKPNYLFIGPHVYTAINHLNQNIGYLYNPNKALLCSFPEYNQYSSSSLLEFQINEIMQYVFFVSDALAQPDVPAFNHIVCISEVFSLLLLISILFYGYTTVCLFIYLFIAKTAP